MSSSVLLIGGEGYIGSVLSNYLLHKGYKVRSLDALIYPDQKMDLVKANIKNFEFILGDIRNKTILKKSLEGINSVVILAGLVGDPITKKYPKEAQEINYHAIKDLINQCDNKKIEKLIFISTCSNYGFIDETLKAKEEHELKPLSLYAKHKVEIENYILSLKGKINFCPTILRFATAFGSSPRMRFDLTVNQFTKELFNKNPLNIYDENTWRPYCHVKDFSRLIEIVLNEKKEKLNFQIFNSGGDQNNFTKKNIIEAITKLIPSNNKISYEPGDKDKRNYRVNFEKVKKLLNFNVEYTIQDGIQEMISSLKSNLYQKKRNKIDKLGNFEINL
tara:strand:- start:24487 stop:25485 length:999 start_codon:yes stop_codon:yes gene_type:complete